MTQVLTEHSDCGNTQIYEETPQHLFPQSGRFWTHCGVCGTYGWFVEVTRIRERDATQQAWR